MKRYLLTMDSAVLSCSCRRVYVRHWQRPTLSFFAVLWLGLFCWEPLQRANAAPGQSFEEARRHWAYQPISSPIPPKVRAATLVQSPIDSFLLARLEQKQLTLAPLADPRTRLRRLYYDLIGLPPSFEQIQAFAKAPSQAAYGEQVEQLLTSPQYGERWGRHWLDVARYADTKDLVLAYGKDALRPYAYTYRDYVVHAFNDDLPFDQFVQDQLAADLVEPRLPRWRLAALGFLTLGRLFDNNPHDQIDDQIDTTTRGFLGLTVACARCHDHKYDAILQQDYYGLYGIFASTERPYDLPLLQDPAQVPGGVEFEQQLTKARQELEQHIDSEFTKLTEFFRLHIGDYLIRAATTKPDITETTQFALSLTPDDFRPALMQRTRHWLEQRASKEDHVFGPWAELMNTEESNYPAFITRAVGKPSPSPLPKWQRRLAAEEGAWTKYNHLIVTTLAQSNPSNKTELAACYAKVLREVYADSKKAGTNAPVGAVNRDQQELLEIVTGEDSPIRFPRRDTPDHMSRPEKDKYNSLVANLDKLAANATNTPPARAMVVADLPRPYQPHVFRRGNPARAEEAVPRAFVRLLSGGTAHAFENGSGRLELARAITSSTNPLTARVFVNRIWMEHFGEPLVASTTDFGARSQPPSHPELLDWLASDFIKSGWSTKHLHRVIVLSHAYQQSSGLSNEADPENILLSHYPRRRLDFEAMRDSLLFAAGGLDMKLGGRPVDLNEDPPPLRRTLYGLVDRQNLAGIYRAFDFAVPDQCAERRPRTTVPQQALFALNSPLVMQQAKALSRLAEIASCDQPADRIDALFRRVLGRQPSSPEIASSLKFIESAQKDCKPEAGMDAWAQLAQVLLISNETIFID